MIAGRRPKPGTKGHLRSMLLATGWDSEAVDIALSPKFDPIISLADMQIELNGKDNEAAAKATVTALREKGYKVNTLPLQDRTTPLWVQEFWDSFTKHPWWTAVDGGQRSILFASDSTLTLSRITAGFVRDLWLNLGEGPIKRFPVVRRFNLLSWASTEALQRFGETVAPVTDVAVVYGGLFDGDHVHETMGYLAALSSLMKGVLLYEAVLHNDLVPEVLMTAARRAGFGFLLGVGARRA